MNTYRLASEVIEGNQVAVVVFTHGYRFSIDSSGDGYTGIWVVKPDRIEKVDKVIVYLRREDETINRIFLGDYTGIEQSEYPRRWTIRFSGLQEIGSTYSNWHEFAGGSSNPINYVMR